MMTGQPTRNVARMTPEHALNWGYTGPILRSTGLAMDQRKDKPYLAYAELDFDVPVGINGDNYDRYYVRMREMDESVHMMRQLMDMLPDGPINVDDRRCIFPPKTLVYSEIESLINHFKLVMEGPQVPAGDIYQALEKGTLDAAEFVGPYDDAKLGFNKVAPYYYYPGWWEGGADLEFFINVKKFNALSDENKAILNAAMAVAATDMTAKYDAYNPIALKKLVAAKTQLKAFSKDLMDAGFKASMEVFKEHEAKSPEFKKIHQDMRAFQRDQPLWALSAPCVRPAQIACAAPGPPPPCVCASALV